MKTRARGMVWIGLLVTGLAVLGAGWSAHGGQVQAQAEVVASLDPLQGLVQHQAADADPQDPASWQPVIRRTIVREGDRVRTSAEGMAYLRFFDGVETEIGPNTLVVVSTLDLPGDDDRFNISLDLLLGNIFNSVDVALDTDDRFEIHTPGATAVVRGTQWWSVVHNDGSSEFSSEDGVVTIIPHRARPDLPARVESVMDMMSPFEMRPGDNTFAMPSGEMMPAPERIRLPDRPAVVALSPTCGDGICRPRERVTCPYDCRDEIELESCGNGTCELAAGEDMMMCPTDCAPFSGRACGNGTCDADESGITCAADCARDRYFQPPAAEMCGNGTCEPTESALNCAADCAPRPTGGDTGAATGDADADIPAEAPAPAGAAGSEATVCRVTGDNINVRRGPGEQFDVVGRLDAGASVEAEGQAAGGLWLAVRHNGTQGWVARRVVTTSGPCDALPVLEGPPPAVKPPAATPDITPSVDSPAAPPGVWGACGSCADCGPYPSVECMLSPDGVCVWNPATCREALVPTAGQLTVPAGTYSCRPLSTFTLVATYTPLEGAIIATYHAAASSGDLVVSTPALLTPLTFLVEVACVGDQPSRQTVSVAMVDSRGQSFATRFAVEITP